MKIRRPLFFLTLLFLIVPAAARANAGVPMIFITLPLMTMGLVPIIALEYGVLVKKLSLPGKDALGTVILANCASTLAGTPLAWMVLAALEMVTGGGGGHGVKTLTGKLLAVTWQAPWLIPHESELYWMIPAASLFLLPPFFWVSYWMEYFIARKMLRQMDALAVRRAVWAANLLSYGLLALAALGWLAGSLFLH